MSQDTAHAQGSAPVTGDRPPPRVVVGVDGSPGSRAALVYAMAAAARREAHLLVVSTYPVQAVWIGAHPPGMSAMSAIRKGTEKRVQDLLDEVRRDLAVVPGGAEVPTLVLVSVGPAAQRLVDASSGVDLLVVGSRGRGAVRSAMLGSVALHCVAHAQCPVVVVHPAPAGHRQERTVIAGVDGSPASRAALVAAVDEAARLGTGVAVVTTYETAEHWVDLSTIVVPTEDEVRWDLQRGVEARADEVRAEHRARNAGRAPDLEVVVTEGPAADVLVRWAADAALLVVGSRGHGELRGLLVGSVALACAMRAHGPVMVVHPQLERSSVETAQRATADA